MTEVTLTHFLVIAALLFAIGIYGALTRKNVILILMSIELMFNAVNVNLVAFSKYVTPATFEGQIFTLFTIVVAACEVGLGLAIVLMLYKFRRSVTVDDFKAMKG